MRSLSKETCITSSLASLPVYLICNFPLVFWFILFSTLFWQLFGGTRDPLLSKLSDQDQKLLTFIKLASLLRALEVLLVHSQVTFIQLFWRISFKVVELSRISGYLVIFITAALFTYLEGMNLQLFTRIRSYLRNRRDHMSRAPDSISYANLIE